VSCRLRGVLVDAFDALYESLELHKLANLVRAPSVLRQALVRS